MRFASAVTAGLGLVFVVWSSGTRASQPATCPPPSAAYQGRAQAIQHLRLVNTLQNASLQKTGAYASPDKVRLDMAQAQLTPLREGARMAIGLNEAGYLASVILPGECTLAIFTDQAGLIFEGLPLR